MRCLPNSIILGALYRALFFACYLGEAEYGKHNNPPYPRTIRNPQIQTLPGHAFVESSLSIEGALSVEEALLIEGTLFGGRGLGRSFGFGMSVKG